MQLNLLDILNDIYKYLSNIWCNGWKLCHVLLLCLCYTDGTQSHFQYILNWGLLYLLMLMFDQLENCYCLFLWIERGFVTSVYENEVRCIDLCQSIVSWNWKEGWKFLSAAFLCLFSSLLSHLYVMLQKENNSYSNR